MCCLGIVGYKVVEDEDEDPGTVIWCEHVLTRYRDCRPRLAEHHPQLVSTFSG
jgi:hypothetical protein